MQHEPIPFRIKTSAIGCRLELDGDDWTERVAAFDLRVGMTEPTVLSLHMIPGTGEIEGEALVHVVDDARSMPDVVCEFLAGVDPTQLEQDALMGMDAGQSVMGAALAQLCAYATGVGR